jgi:TolB-like protein/Tfp pilus assembly protein PilF
LDFTHALVINSSRALPLRHPIGGCVEHPLARYSALVRQATVGSAAVQFSFADHTLDIARRELRRGEESIALEPQVFDLLAYLVQSRDRVVSKDDLIATVWGGRIVSDATLSSRIYAARKALGDSGEQQKLIRTVARKGLRFVAAVSTQPLDQAPAFAAVPPADEQPSPALPLPDRPAIAVLPFVNMSGDPEQEYFSDGISEDIIAALSKLRWFFVIARNSTFIYKGQAVLIREVAKELGVRYVVEGSVRKASGRVRITVQLNDAATGGQIWSERYDRDLADVFALQDEITAAIVASIEPQLYAAENVRSRRKTPDSLDAWELVMRALSHYWRVTRDDSLTAHDLLEQAIAIDPHYGQALGLLAASHAFSAYMGWTDTAASFARAEAAATAAVRADGDDPWAQHALGCVHVLAHRLDDAFAQFELALSLNPNFAVAQGYQGVVLSLCGRYQEAIAAAERALRLSPRDPFSAIYCGIAASAHFGARNYAEAMRLARDAMRQRGDFVGAHRVLTTAAGMAGAAEVAAAALGELRRVQPNVSLDWLATHMPIRHPAEMEHYLEGFRRAGLA